MKNIIIKLFCCATVVVSATSCNDWLEMPSESKYDSSTIFESISKAEMAVEGCYANTFNREFYYQLGMGTDECVSTEGETNSKNQIANYVYTSSNSPTGLYNAMYIGIEYANTCIKNLSGMKGNTDAEQKKIEQLLGESYAIRSMNYLNLVRYFGDVPFLTVPTADAESFTSSRVSRDTIYDHCISDLQKATTLLAWKSEGLVSTPERFTKNAAYGILARMALYAAGYSLRWDLNTYDASPVKLAQRSDTQRIKELYKIAIDACKAVIDRGENSLLSSYEQVFRNLMQKKYDDESMLLYAQYGTNVNGAAIGYTNGIFCHTSSMYGKAAPAMVANPTYYFSFKDDDLRRDVTICNYGVTNTNAIKMNTFSSMTVGKFRVDWKADAGTGVNKRDIDWPVLRYSDVILMYAEALNEYNNGPTAEAVNALKQVRMRAFGNDETKIGTIPTDYSDFRNAIINERKYELGFESWRRTDLVRWGILYETLVQNKKDLVSLANLDGDYAGVSRYRAYKMGTAISFSSSLVALNFKNYQAEPTSAESLELQNEGYTIVDMFSGSGNLANSTSSIGASQAWMTSGLFRGLEKNKVELLPLNQTSVIDVNTGLQGQQHPLY